MNPYYRVRLFFADQTTDSFCAATADPDRAEELARAAQSRRGAIDWQLVFVAPIGKVVSA